MVRSGDLFGDAVNVAARRPGLAQPGAVCLSGSAYEYVHTVLAVTFEDLVTQLVKNLDSPIRAYLTRPSGHPLSRALPPVHRRIVAHLARRFHALCHAALMEVMGPENLVPTEFAVIASVHDAPGIDQGQLAERVGIDLATARRIVKRLERRGFVQRALNAGGGRSRVLSPTPAGIEVLAAPTGHSCRPRPGHGAPFTGRGIVGSIFSGGSSRPVMSKSSSAASDSAPARRGLSRLFDHRFGQGPGMRGRLWIPQNMSLLP
jgi:DNA-binding MarR family transcriptional regulator